MKNGQRAERDGEKMTEDSDERYCAHSAEFPIPAKRPDLSAQFKQSAYSKYAFQSEDYWIRLGSNKSKSVTQLIDEAG